MAKNYQVFIGCPFLSSIRKNYDKLKKELENKTPLHIVLADTTAVSSTDYLLEHITSLIRESAVCIFDITGGNPNVSLEVGIAHALPAEFLLTLYTRKPNTPKKAEKTLEREGGAKPIISDIQGRNRIEYKSFKVLKKQLLSRFLTKTNYMKRWDEFRKRHTSYESCALKLFHEIRLSGRTLRPRVVSLLDGTGIETNDFLKALSDAKLLTVKIGRGGGIYYPK
jgi:hypothetical protein